MLPGGGSDISVHIHIYDIQSEVAKNEDIVGASNDIGSSKKVCGGLSKRDVAIIIIFVTTCLGLIASGIYLIVGIGLFQKNPLYPTSARLYAYVWVVQQGSSQIS